MGDSNSVIEKKSYFFALQIIKLYKYLSTEKKDYTLSKQILRAGTSIGANIVEALSAESKRDFVHKLGIAQKEIKETSYWLNLLLDSEYISKERFTELIKLCDELYRILTAIILTTKQRYLK
ncbi:MAG: four helix bundle protein [Ferruginibacter sp.]